MAENDPAPTAVWNTVETRVQGLNASRRFACVRAALESRPELDRIPQHSKELRDWLANPGANPPPPLRDVWPNEYDTAEIVLALAGALAVADKSIAILWEEAELYIEGINKRFRATWIGLALCWLPGLMDILNSTDEIRGWLGRAGMANRGPLEESWPEDRNTPNVVSVLMEAIRVANHAAKHCGRIEGQVRKRWRRHAEVDEAALTAFTDASADAAMATALGRKLLEAPNEAFLEWIKGSDQHTLDEFVKSLNQADDVAHMDRKLDAAWHRWFDGQPWQQARDRVKYARKEWDDLCADKVPGAAKAYEAALLAAVSATPNLTQAYDNDVGFPDWIHQKSDYNISPFAPLLNTDDLNRFADVLNKHRDPFKRR